MRRLYVMAAALLWVHPVLAAHTTARLLLSHEAARPGETVWAGLQLSMDSGWNTYWRNSGESGLPTTVAWKLPDSVTAGEILWPTPEKHRSSGQITYVYHGQVILLVPLRLADSVKAGTLDIQADLLWLECEKICVKGQGTVIGKVLIGPDTKASAEAAKLEAARTKLPVVKSNDFVRAWWEGPAKGEKRILWIEWMAQKPGAKGDFYPFASKEFDVEPGTTPVTAGVATGAVRLRKTVHTFGGSWPAQLMGLAVEQAGGVTSGAFEVAATIADEAPPAAAAAAAVAGGGREEAPGQRAAAGEPAGGEVSDGERPGSEGETESARATPLAPMGMGALFLNLGLAFVGGLILNLMPCVLPVIALKILASSIRATGRRRKRGG